jgi:hypothetical protein
MIIWGGDLKRGFLRGYALPIVFEPHFGAAKPAVAVYRLAFHFSQFNHVLVLPELILELTPKIIRPPNQAFSASCTLIRSSALDSVESRSKFNDHSDVNCVAKRPVLLFGLLPARQSRIASRVHHDLRVRCIQGDLGNMRPRFRQRQSFDIARKKFNRFLIIASAKKISLANLVRLGSGGDRL